MFRKVAGAIVASSLCGTCANAVPISFGDLYRDPGAPIAVAPDGSIATLSEDPNFFAVALSNIPLIGDPELIVAHTGTVLSFNFNFVEPIDNADVFHFSILDGLTGESVGGGFDSYFTSTGTGLLQFDLSSLVGRTLGLQFELVPELEDASFTSVLELSNLDLTTPAPPDEPPAEVPEPSTLPLFIISLGLFAFGGRRLWVREDASSPVRSM